MVVCMSVYANGTLLYSLSRQISTHLERLVIFLTIRFTKSFIPLLFLW